VSINSFPNAIVKWAIMAVLSECCCNSPSKSSVFNRLSAAAVSNSSKRYRSQKKKPFFDVEYPEVTSNMVVCALHRASPKGSNRSSALASLTMNFLLVWKKYWANQKGCYTRTGTIALVNYSTLTRGIDMNDAHPATTESHASNSSTEKEAFAYIEGTRKEVAKRFAEQAQI